MTFAQGVSYQSAVRVVTDLGLQARTFCEGLAYSSPGSSVATQGWWEPEASAKDFPVIQGPGAGRGRLYVSRTPLSPPDWATRLANEATVVMVQDFPSEPSCPLHIIYSAPPADAVQYVGEDQVDMQVRVRFASSVPYEDAVVLVSRLGFRLSDPCYEQAVAGGSKPTWQPMGQEAGFANEHTLLVRVTEVNAASWRQQLTSGAGVQAVEAPAPITC